MQYAEAEVAFFDDVVSGAIARRDEIDALLSEQAGRGLDARPARQDHAADPARRRLRTASPAPTCRPAPRSANTSTSPTPSSNSARRSSSTACSMPWRRRCAESGELAFIEALRGLATHPCRARSSTDDCAVLELGGETLVLTHDTLVEGVHFLPGQDPGRRRVEAGGDQHVRSCRQGCRAAGRAAGLSARDGRCAVSAGLARSA